MKFNKQQGYDLVMGGGGIVSNYYGSKNLHSIPEFLIIITRHLYELCCNLDQRKNSHDNNITYTECTMWYT